MSNRLTFSIIGCEHGHISVMIREMLEMGHTCAGIYERRNEELRDKIAKRFDIPVVHNVEELLVDRVSIVGSSAINNEKIDIIELCEKYDKHVMVDKPAVTNREGYDRLQAVIQRGRIQVGMLLTERFRPIFHTLKKNISKGIFGDIVSISMRKPHKLRAETRPQWHFSKEQNGGIVIDLFVHDFDLLRWLTGQEIETSEGFISKNILSNYPKFYDTAFLHVQLNGQTLAQLYSDWHTPTAFPTYGDGRVFVVGTEAYAELRLSGDPFISDEEILLQTSHTHSPQRIRLEEPSCTIMEDFLKRIQGEGYITHTDVLATSLATIDADEKVKRILGAGQGKSIVSPL